MEIGFLRIKRNNFVGNNVFFLIKETLSRDFGPTFFCAKMLQLNMLTNLSTLFRLIVPLQSVRGLRIFACSYWAQGELLQKGVIIP